MKIINANPYRIVGLLVGATAREQNRQIKRLKQFIEAEQEPQDDFSFPVLGRLERTIESVDEAASKLNLDQDKMYAAMFWFYNGNDITDEPAFVSLKDSGEESAIEVWSKLTSSGEVTNRNCSAFQNLSTLLLLISATGENYGTQHFKQGIILKLKYLESDFVKDLIDNATDVTYKISKKELQLSFLSAIHEEIERSKRISTDEFIGLLNKENFIAKEEFLKSFIQKPIERIENLITDCKTHRKTTKKDVIVAANDLYKSTRPILSTIKNVLGTSNQQFISISDKVSEEILQCGIQLFNDYREHETYDPSEPAMKLFKEAKSLAFGNIVRQRIEENTGNLQEWIDDKPARELNNKVGEDIEFIIERLNLASETLKLKGRYPRGYDDPYSDLPFNEQPQNKPFNPYSDMLETGPYAITEIKYNINLFRLARDTVKKCKPKLDKIKDIVGSSNEIFQKLSYDVASLSLACLIEYVNNSGNATLGIPPTISEHMVSAMTAIGELEMNYEMRKRYDEQNQALNNLRRTVQRASRSSSGGGCYIATMAYGDYDHPQVLVLRNYRDNILAKNIAGRFFIKCYYIISPKLVKVLKNQITINSLIRRILNQIINQIKI